MSNFLFNPDFSEKFKKHIYGKIYINHYLISLIMVFVD